MSMNHDASIKFLEMQIGQSARQIVVLPISSGGFIGKTIDNPKNESCRAVETGFKVITNKGQDETVKEVLMEKEEVRIERGLAIGQLIDKNYPWRRTKKKILNDFNPYLPDYTKPPYPIIKKKPIHEDEAGMFEKFKEMLTTLQVSILFHEVLELIPKFSKFMKALLKGTNQKVVKEQVNMNEKDEIEVPQTLPPKL